jgi:hypothetical protein
MNQTNHQSKRIPRPLPDKPKWNVRAIIGMVAFFSGMILAAVAGIFWKNTAGISLALVILGIVVGILNISDREVMPFLVSAIALVVVGSGSFTVLNDIVDGFGTVLNGIVGYIATFMVPAAIINAIRSMWRFAQPS